MRRSGVRRLSALVHGLPLDAVVWREERPKWTQEHELLALVTEALAPRLDLIWRQLIANAGKTPPQPPSQPLRFDHPDRPRPQRKRISAEQLTRIVNQGG